ncbi:MAG TPA: hypothetical protein PK402_07840 [Tepidisphaeraceae bacterium]|nr:hypothetical protein [Tepidisphaeraceae bacterium]
MAKADSAQPKVDAKVDATQAQPDPTQARPGAAPQLSFWRKPWVLQAMPLLTSFAFHAGLVLVAIVLIRAVPQIIDAVVQEQVIIPEGQMTDETELGPIQTGALSEDVTDQATQDNDPTVMELEKWRTQDSPQMQDSNPDTESKVTPIGQGVRAVGALGDPNDSGTGTGAKSPFGPKSSKSGIFQAAPAGGGNARKIVYLCDASGSIGTSAARKTVLISELKKAVDALKPSQHFNVVFFSYEDPIALSNGSLMQATPANRQKAYDFLDKVVMSGQTDPIPALKLAFKQNPELIYLLTDGEFTAVEPQAVIDTVKSLNPRNQVVIRTIMLDSTNEAEQETLKEIARMTGGIFTSVSAQDIIRSGK